MLRNVLLQIDTARLFRSGRNYPMSVLKNEAGNAPKRASNQRFGPNCSDLDPAEVSAAGLYAARLFLRPSRSPTSLGCRMRRRPPEYTYVTPESELNMKTLGIIGGIGPESTIDYYRLLLAAYRERTRDGSAPAILINSIDMDRMLGMIAAGEVEKMTQYLVSEVLKLARAGADFVLMAANTPHIAFTEISRQSPIPMISI